MNRGPSTDATYDEWLSKHTLQVHVETAQLQAYYLRLPSGGRMQSVFILFTQEGIIICGDWCPADGVFSRGYGRDWFASTLGADYLASKFLRKGWVPELAGEQMRERILRRRWENRGDEGESWYLSKEQARTGYDRVKRALEYNEFSPADAYEIACDVLNDPCMDGMGHHFDPHDAALLAAIQRRFVALWAEHTQQAVAA